MNILIRNGLIVDPSKAEVVSGDISIQHGKIATIGEPPEKANAEITIDADGHWIMPGLIDCQARLRDPGQPEKANINSETEAAIKEILSEF